MTSVEPVFSMGEGGEIRGGFGGKILPLKNKMAAASAHLLLAEHTVANQMKHHNSKTINKHSTSKLTTKTDKNYKDKKKKI